MQSPTEKLCTGVVIENTTQPSNADPLAELQSLLQVIYYDNANELGAIQCPHDFVCLQHIGIGGGVGEPCRGVIFGINSVDYYRWVRERFPFVGDQHDQISDVLWTLSPMPPRPPALGLATQEAIQLEGEDELDTT